LFLISMSAQRAPGLTGTWVAERNYDTAVRSAAVTLARRRAWTATIGGRQASAADSSAPVFTFKDGSQLRVRFDGGPKGQWIQPGDPGNGEPIASPVAFKPAGRNRWRGAIRPIDRVEHLLLFVQRAPGSGAPRAFIRNPEINAGARVGTRTVVVAGEGVRLVRPGQADITGRWSPKRDTLTLVDPGLPGTFVFTRRPPVDDSKAYSYRTPSVDGDGWKTGTLREAGLDETAIARIVDRVRNTAPGVRATYVQSLLIARHGKLVLDEYFNGYDASRPHDVRSAGKSIATLLVGRAIEDTRSFSPQTSIATILTNYEPFANDDGSKERITVGDLMSMSAGYACDDNDDASPGNEDRMQAQSAQPDWYKFTLDLPMLFAPGTSARYCSAESNLLGAIVSKETGVWLPDYFYDRFAEPMQFGGYGMWLTPPPLRTAYMAGGDDFRPRDFLKFGELFLDDGRWNGKAIVDGAWLTGSAAKHAFLADDGGDFGYGWHLPVYQVHGRTIRAINAGGNGGQLLYAFPQLDMAVMITAANYGQYPVWKALQDDLVPKILNAVE
jgi:CubicO group peptidase (beta-lactamase class C family)